MIVDGAAFVVAVDDLAVVVILTFFDKYFIFVGISIRWKATQWRETERERTNKNEQFLNK